MAQQEHYKGGGGFVPRPPEVALNALWPNYLKDGYFDAGGNLKTDYVGRNRVDLLAKGMADARPSLTVHQLRRFFQHVRAIETKLRAKTSTWEEQNANFAKLAVAAADAFGKKERKIPKLFYDFINCNTDAVKSERDFLKGFIPHFEALVGFGSLHFKEKEKN